jgi:hypothetical protein
MDEQFEGWAVRLAVLVLLIGMATYVLAAAWRARSPRRRSLEITPRHAPGLRGLP